MNKAFSGPDMRLAASPLQVGAVLGGIVFGAVLVFGLGVWVGRSAVEKAPLASAPPPTLPAENIPPLPPNLAASTAAPIAAKQLTFFDRLSGTAPATPVPPPGQAPPPAYATTAPPAPAPTAALAPRATKSAPPKPAPPAAPLDVTREASTADSVAQIKKLTGKGLFAVQVASVTQRSAALEQAVRLKKRGFSVAIVNTAVRGKTWYRVRIWSFPDQQSAAKAAGILRSAFGYNGIVVHD